MPDRLTYRNPEGTYKINPKVNLWVLSFMSAGARESEKVVQTALSLGHSYTPEFITGWRHALWSEWPFIIIIITFVGFSVGCWLVRCTRTCTLHLSLKCT